MAVVLVVLTAATSAAAGLSLPEVHPFGKPLSEARTQVLSIGELGDALSQPGAEPRYTKPKKRRAKWLKGKLRRKVLKRGRKGKPTPVEDIIFKSCPGVGPTVPGVQAGTCIVVPAGCTANFIFYDGPVVRVAGQLRPAGATLPPFRSDGEHWYIGTAGHCLTGGGGPVYMQVRPPGIYLGESNKAGGIAAVGTAGKKMNGGVGRDFGVVQIYEGFNVTPSLPIGGPVGIYSGCAPAPIHYYGHGYYAAVAQGKPEGGPGFFPDDSYYWAGPILPGDSGSGALVGTLAAGDVTHGLGIGPVPLPVGYGTRMTKILDFLGSGFYLVNADGSLSRNTTRCSGVDPLGPLI